MDDAPRRSEEILRSTAGWIVNDRRVERIWLRPPDNPSNVASGLPGWSGSSSPDVIDVLSDQFILRGVPEHIRSDNGPELSPK